MLDEAFTASSRLRTALYNIVNAHKVDDGNNTVRLRLTNEQAIYIKDMVEVTLYSLNTGMEMANATIISNLEWQAKMMGYTLVKNA